jgi:hypothetical protein
MMAITGPWQSLLLAYCRARAKRPQVRATPVSLLPEMIPSGVAARLERDGWAECSRLPVQQLLQISEFFENSPRARLGEPHEHCKALWDLAHDPNVLQVVRLYLKGEPILYNSVIWRTEGVKHPDYVRQTHHLRFHFDVADVKSLCLFIYLSHVDEDCGPHIVISGTHHRKSLWDTARLYLDDGRAQARYADRIRMITGGPGTAFFEEQTVYHKQLMPLKPRLMLRITYTLWRSPPRSVAGEPKS